MTPENYEKLRSKIILACPELKENEEPIYKTSEVWQTLHPIRIAHVLRALNYFVKRDYYVGITGGFYQSGCCEETEYLYTDWNLEQDDLALQSDEVKQFLFDLLTPKTDE